MQTCVLKTSPPAIPHVVVLLKLCLAQLSTLQQFHFDVATVSV